MTVADNKNLVKGIEILLAEKFPIRLGVNKKNELVRLVYEICRACDTTLSGVIRQIRADELIAGGRGELFHRLKGALLSLRYPTIGPKDNPHIMPLVLDDAAGECPVWDFKIYPKNIFMEKEVRDLKWTNEFVQKFPESKIVHINKLDEALDALSAEDPIKLYNARRENIFLVKKEAAFIKVCPCTKGCRRCGYWILNIGFGCPVDCSYCYLQTYSNAPGLVLPANIEDYYGYIEQFDAKAAKRTRIGTGEFTDSLALDKFTGYSSRLINFFSRAKKLTLELKTKVGNIDNVLKEKPNDNVVISWSINTRKMTESYEKGSATMDERIEGALLAAQRGYKVGFHFDPIVYYPGWEDEYKATVEDIFSNEIISRNTAWISLGTLRYTPGLKQIAEGRFSDNLIFYQGEFFIDTDGKLRYPRMLRVHIYNRMISWIRAFGTPAWIYLCMEPEELWRKTTLEKSKYEYNVV